MNSPTRPGGFILPADVVYSTPPPAAAPSAPVTVRQPWPLRRVISGGQTGSDQAALTAAITLGYEPGGTVPRGRRTEAGALTDAQMTDWRLIESRHVGYEHRTRANVRGSDGTLIIALDRLDGGSALTHAMCVALQKPCCVVVVTADVPAQASVIRQWIQQHGIRVLNVAGNRESKAPGIFIVTHALLMEALRHGT